MTYFLLVLKCRFKGIDSSDCPDNSNLDECTHDMQENELCEADVVPLPDGNKNVGIDNCGNYDVFKCTGGKWNRHFLVDKTKHIQVIGYYKIVLNPFNSLQNHWRSVVEW